MSSSQTRIESDLQTIGDILKADFKYRVPPHQRNFAWSIEEVEQLWNDITDALSEDLPEYFLGTIVVQENREEKTRGIIDGQQRLATLAMFFAAIRTVYQEHGDDRANEVYNDYLGVRDRRTRLTDSRLTLNQVNEPIFQKLVIDNAADKEFDSVIKHKGENSSNVFLSKVAQFIRTAVREKTKADKKYETFLIELEEFVRDRIVVILVRVGDEADAYLIFETLNDRGLDLSISDLLKNYIFSKAGNRLDVVKKQWQEMVIILGTQDQTQFLRHYWLSKYGIVREKDLYKEMKKKFSSQSAVLRLMTELRDEAEKYAAISSTDHALWKGYGTSVRRDLETLQVFSISQFRPLLLAALETLDEKEVAKVIHIIVVVSMRYSIIGSLGTGNIEKSYSDIAMSVRGKKANTAAKIFAGLKNIYPDDDRFWMDFSFKSITKPKLARYILAALANNIQGSKELVVLEDEKVVNLEHIMPKTRSSDWLRSAASEEEYNEHVNRLGNMTLIERDKNHAVDNASFKRKKNDAFCSSDIKITKDLCVYNNWSIGDIQKRQMDFGKTALKIWTLPY